MTNREMIWRRACQWVAGWQGGKQKMKPTPELAYLAGWQAAMRTVNKAKTKEERKP